MRMHLSEILTAVEGQLLTGSDSISVNGVATDTRKIKKGELFVAIKGDNFYGNDFTLQAIRNGARALIVSRPDIQAEDDVTVILVKDTVKALGRIAHCHRRKFNIPVIAVTGSAGKTTTKELIASVLKTKFNVLYNKGTENNHIGVPMTLLQLKSRHEVAVIECGTNHRGEIAWLGSIVEPTIAVFTNVGHSHLAGLDSPAGVFKEKASLLRYLQKKGLVIFNVDDPFLKRISKMGGQRMMSYGIQRLAKVQARNVQADARGISFFLEKNKVLLKTPVLGNVYNALAAIACGISLKMTFADIVRGLDRFQSPKGRQVFHRAGKITIIDDTYNANPISFKNAVSTLKIMKNGGRAILIGADMLELGKMSSKLHKSVGAFAAVNNVDRLLTCGKMARFISMGARGNGLSDCKHFADQEDLLNALKMNIKDGDVVLVKGSRGMRMERIVENLIEYLQNGSARKK